jgi:hypothetical protein
MIAASRRVSTACRSRRCIGRSSSSARSASCSTSPRRRSSNALSAVFSGPPHHVAPYQLSLLLASVFAGGAIGAPLLGLFADRRGRRLALATSLLLLAVTSTIARAPGRRTRGKR